MGSTTPCPDHFAHSFSQEALAAHESSCPTVTHALVPELYKALDPEFITIRVRRQAFGLDIFKMLGEAMKVHCAPVRDAMVDEMVETATRGQVAFGLRKAFDCVEVMKLVSRACAERANRRTLPTIRYTRSDPSSGDRQLATSSQLSERPSSPRASRWKILLHGDG